ncbi:hypothetical protein [Stenotrophomonas sp. GD03657]|uniref:hypothetical protein n=1 Tax=Stenotrophomonas sp. GD03657 TaxID=2975363 RepID=UPI002447CA1D|nr:hypothetical protein [Stenotrophomonas sp. GD03657]MDH2154101.1 hypothetical protein [Stenotrophomonas sp. GD03657]
MEFFYLFDDSQRGWECIFIFLTFGLLEVIRECLDKLVHCGRWDDEVVVAALTPIPTVVFGQNGVGSILQVVLMARPNLATQQ